MARIAKVAVDLEANSAKFTEGLSRADRALAASGAKWQRSLSDIQRKMTSFSGIAGAVIGGIATSSAITALYDVNAEFQRLGASLKTVTGSTSGAQAAMEMIRDFAAETPYQLTEVTDAFIKLKAMGLDTSIESLRSFGNTASAMGKPIQMMIEAVADAATGEFERLKEFGIKSSSEGDKVIFTFQGVKTTIGKNASEIENYLRGLGEVQFGGAMAEQMNTLGGQISNLVDQFDALISAIGEAGANDAMSMMLKSITKGTKNLTDSINELFSAESKLQRISDTLAKESSLSSRVLSAPSDLMTWAMKPVLGGATSYDQTDFLTKEKKALEELIAVQKEAKLIREERLRLEERATKDLNNKSSSEVSPTEQKKADNIQKQITDLQFKEAQLNRTARAQAVYAELQKAGIDMDAKEGQAIADMAGKLYDKTQAVEAAKKAQEEAIKKAEEQVEVREKITSGLTQEVSDNEKLIAALQVSQAEYERVAAMLELVNSFRQAGIDLSPEELQNLEKLTDTLGNQRLQLDGMKDKYADLNKLGADMGMSFSSAFEDAIVEGKKFSDVLDSLYQDILRLMVRQTVTQPLAASSGSLFSGMLSSLPSMLGFASGTSSAPPGMAWVGERGPELVKFRGGEQVFPSNISKMISDSFRLPGFADGAFDGAALSAANMGGSHGDLQVNVINNAGSDVSAQRRMVGGVDTLEVTVDKMVSKKLGQRGSRSNQTIRGTYGVNESLASR